MRVGIIGAGPAGLVLARLLEREGIDTVVLERRSREYVEGRVRAGVLEHSTAELLTELGVGDRMRREGQVHRGVVLRYDGEDHRIDLEGLTGRTITVYGQQEVVKDLIAARLAGGLPLHFGAEVTGVDGGTVRYRHDGAGHDLACDFVAGCDGSHGITAGLPVTRLESPLPYAWLGILARAKPANDELVYAYHERGFALHSMRTPEIVRLYLQVAPDTDLAQWPDERVWEELHTRLGLPLTPGPVLEKSVTPMRSMVSEPMQHGRIFLAGDAAHIVPPTGAKGLNLAVADVLMLARCLTFYHRTGSGQMLGSYSQSCSTRIWMAQRFSRWMTTMLHRHPGDDTFGHRLRRAELAATVHLHSARAGFAENYVGLPFSRED